jgi:hypothetical protein
LRDKGGEFVTVFEPELDLEFGIGGVIFGPARGQRFAVLGHGEWMDGNEPAELLWAPRRHDRPLLECQTHGHRLPVKPRAQALDPRVDRLRAVVEAQKLPVRRAPGVSTEIVFGLGPVEAHKGRTCFGWVWRHVCSPRVWYSGAKGQAGWRSAKA